MISLRNFALRRGERLLLSNVDLTLHAGYRVGVVGRNGAGKSSLFAAVRGELEADKGDVSLPGKIRIADVAQETPALAERAIDFVLGGDDVVAAQVLYKQQASPVLYRDRSQQDSNSFTSESGIRWVADKATAATVDKVGGNMLSQPGKEVVNGQETMVDQIVVKYCKLDKKETAKLNQAVKK